MRIDEKLKELAAECSESDPLVYAILCTVVGAIHAGSIVELATMAVQFSAAELDRIRCERAAKSN